MSYENIIVDRKDAVAVITLNRPKALNALSATLTRELEAALIELDGDSTIGCMIITGSERPSPLERISKRCSLNLIWMLI